MTREQAVLCIGVEWPLLSVRMQTLKAAGFQVVIARDEKQARSVVHYFRFQAAILCHSLGDALRQEITADMREIQPGLPILQLQAHDREPDMLITAVSAVTGSPMFQLQTRAPYLSCWARCTGLERAIVN